VGAPSLSFASETDTGIYRSGAGSFNIAVDGAMAVDLTSSGMKVPVGIAGGAF
jgi:hypothetical protein